MKTKFYIGGLLLFYTFLNIACNKKAEGPVSTAVIDKEKIKMEIQAIENTFAEHFNARNTDSITYYAEDAKSFFIGQNPITTKDSILDYLNNNIKAIEKGIKFSFTTNEVYVSNDGSNVTEIGQYKLLDSTGTKIESGNYFSVFEKKNGKYICIRDIATSDMPKEDK